MGLDISSLKDFFPFGSAMLGAVTGGFITYRMSKATQRKEKRLKGLESINEVKLLIYDISMSIRELQFEMDEEYKENGMLGADEILVEHILKVPEFFKSMLMGKGAICYTKAMHINTDVYYKTFNTYKEIYYLNIKMVEIAEKADEKELEWFVQEILGLLQSSYDFLEDLAQFLGVKEQELIQEYMEKYIKEKRFYIF